MEFSTIKLPTEEKVKVEKVALNLNLWPRKTKIEVTSTIVESGSEIGKHKKQTP